MSRIAMASNGPGCPSTWATRPAARWFCPLAGIASCGPAPGVTRIARKNAGFGLAFQSRQHYDGSPPEIELLRRRIEHAHLALVLAWLQLIQRNAELYR